MIPQNTCKAHGTQLAHKKTGIVILLFLSTTTKDFKKKKRLLRKINQSLG